LALGDKIRAKVAEVRDGAPEAGATKAEENQEDLEGALHQSCPGGTFSPRLAATALSVRGLAGPSTTLTLDPLIHAHWQTYAFGAAK
jgi:hypothetical protein